MPVSTASERLLLPLSLPVIASASVCLYLLHAYSICVPGWLFFSTSVCTTLSVSTLHPPPLSSLCIYVFHLTRQNTHFLIFEASV